MDAVIRDVKLSNAVAGEFVEAWVGRPWIETVAESGVERVRRSLDDARTDGLSAFRQILQRFPSGLELPIEYTTVQLGDSGGLIAIGRNLQASSELQSRLIAAQQAMERDYWKLRAAETRYRVLFDASNDAVLVLASDDLHVIEANPSAIRALGVTRGWDFLTELTPHERDPFRDMLNRVRDSGRAPGGIFHIGAAKSPWVLKASLMNDETGAVYMLQLAPLEAEALAAPEAMALDSLIQSIPDGFIVIDGEGVVHHANRAFLDMVQVDGETSVVGRQLDSWFQRAGSDLSGLLAKLRLQGKVRLFAATIRGERGAKVDVDISAGGDAGNNPTFIGMVLRKATRQIAAPIEQASLPALPALPALKSAGRTPLKQLVQAAVSIVERHYVESALQITDGNRTAAAERLGLSRQSLYAKLNRYGLDSSAEGETPKTALASAP